MNNDCRPLISYYATESYPEPLTVSQFLAAKYFCKTVHLTYLTEFSIRLPLRIALPSRQLHNQFNNRNTRKRTKICSKVTIKAPERCQWPCYGVFIVNFEQVTAGLLLACTISHNYYINFQKHLFYDAYKNSCSEVLENSSEKNPDRVHFSSSCKSLYCKSIK